MTAYDDLPTAMEEARRIARRTGERVRIAFGGWAEYTDWSGLTVRKVAQWQVTGARHA